MDAAQLVATYFTPEDLARGARHAFADDLGLAIDLTLDLALLVTLALSPLGRRLHAALAKRFPGFRADALFLALVAILREIVGFPVSVWRDFLTSHELGISSETFGTFLLHALRDTLLTTLAFALLGAVLPKLRSLLPRGWWLAVGVTGALVLVGDAALDPYLMQLNYAMTELPAGSLRTRLESLLTAQHADARQIVVLDASKDTTAVNAFVTGVGPTRKLVLTDTLVAMGAEAVVGAVAHEIGHRRDERLPGRLALAAFGLVAFLGLVELVLRFALKHGASATSQALPLVIAAFTLLNVATLPFRAASGRAEEREADELELSVRRDYDAYVAEQVELARANALEPLPGALDRLLADHPSAMDRIARALWYKERFSREIPGEKAGTK